MQVTPPSIRNLNENLTPSERQLVFSLHGIRTRGVWQKTLTTSLSDAGFTPVPLDFGFFRALSLVLPWRREKKVRWFLDQYTAATKGREGLRPSIIAHSFGTYLVARTLEKHAEVRFDRVIFCGSIVPREYSWSTVFGNDQITRVLNDHGGRDFWAKVARFAVNDAGPSGNSGFEDAAGGRVIQRGRPKFSHSDFFYTLNYQDVWIPFLKGLDPSKLAEAPKRSINWAFRISSIAIFALVLFLLWIVATHLRKNPAFVTPPNSAASEMTITPLTPSSGVARDSSISPNDDDLAYVWDGDSNGTQSLYVKRIASGPSLRLTTADEGNIESPTWSNDGKYIYYIRSVNGTHEIWRVPSLGGPDKRKIGSMPLYPEIAGQHPSLTISPDDKYLAIASGGFEEGPPGIFLISTSKSEEPRRITTAEFGDSQPSFSRDGKELAFVRSTSLGVEDLYVVSLAKIHALRRLTTDGNRINGIAWTPDGREIVFASDRGGIFGLWRIGRSGPTPRRVGITGNILASPSISRQSNRLTLTEGSSTTSIWKLSVSAMNVPSSGLQKLASSGADESPEYSPDANKIVFVSSQTGNPEIWKCDKHGSNRIQLTNAKGPITGTPRWSPDGRLIAYDSRTSGHSRIYIIQDDGSQAYPITSGPGEDTVPSWSVDGAWIFFASTRSGKNQIWKARASGGPAVQITRGGGFAPLQSRDGKFVYYAKDPKVAGIWRVPVDGGPETGVTDDLGVGLWGQWALSRDGIYFVGSKGNGIYALKFFSFGFARTKDIIALPYPPALWTVGLSVSVDGHEILHTLVEPNSRILLVENFR